MASRKKNGGKRVYTEPPKAVLFCGLIYGPQADLPAVLQRLMGAWGRLEFISRRIPFSYSTYYDNEMGDELTRRFCTFQRAVPQEALTDLKGLSEEMETVFLREGGGRTVNIDPGLLLPDRLVLASTKPGPHRPYLGRGVYADLTLLFQKKTYRSLPWTYPDYAEPETIQMMNRLRERHRNQMRWRPESDPP